MKCSLRVWFLSVAFLLVFIMSLLFTYSHHSMATLPYLDSGGLGGTHRVKLVPGYAGLQRLSKEGLTGKSCACRRCMGDAGASDWFDSHFNSNISPVWTRENMDLPPDVQRWWMVRAAAPPAYPLLPHLQGSVPLFGSHSSSPAPTPQPWDLGCLSSGLQSPDKVLGPLDQSHLLGS